MASEAERDSKIRELTAELTALRHFSSKEAGLRVARIIRELIELGAAPPRKD